MEDVKTKRRSKESVENTNPFSIYPDQDEVVDPKIMRTPEIEPEELVLDTDLINPDPNSLDRG